MLLMYVCMYVCTGEPRSRSQGHRQLRRSPGGGRRADRTGQARAPTADPDYDAGNAMVLVFHNPSFAQHWKGGEARGMRAQACFCRNAYKMSSASLDSSISSVPAPRARAVERGPTSSSESSPSVRSSLYVEHMTLPTNLTP